MKFNKNNIVKIILIMATTFLTFGIIFGAQSAWSPGGFYSFLNSTAISTVIGVLIWLNVEIETPDNQRRY